MEYVQKHEHHSKLALLGFAASPLHLPPIATAAAAAAAAVSNAGGGQNYTTTKDMISSSVSTVLSTTSDTVINRTLVRDVNNVSFGSLTTGIVLSLMSAITTIGNSLVLYAILRKEYLHTSSNLILGSLAAGDLMVGLVIMPLSIVNHILQDYWPFGTALCDLYMSVDVFASTVSIWSLCLIAMDRYKGVEQPVLCYNRSLRTRPTLIKLTLIWTISAVLSFPAVAYWHVRSTHTYDSPTVCLFTDDIYYVLFSSFISFYLPFPITLFCYWNVFRAATQHEAAIRQGRKRLSAQKCKNRKNGGKSTTNSEGGGLGPGGGSPGGPGGKTSSTNNNDGGVGPPSRVRSLYIRVHRGNTQNSSHNINNSKQAYNDVNNQQQGEYGQNKSTNNHNPLLIGETSKHQNYSKQQPYPHNIIENTAAAGDTDSMIQNDGGVAGLDGEEMSMDDSSSSHTRLSMLADSIRRHRFRHDSTSTGGGGGGGGRSGGLSSSLGGRSRGGGGPGGGGGRRKSAFSNIFPRLLQEQRAAKMLGIVIGCFTVCWTPFFIVNILKTLCRSCIPRESESDLFNAVTWLGYTNSMLNPWIYTFFNRELQRAFREICRSRSQNRRRNRNRSGGNRGGEVFGGGHRNRATWGESRTTTTTTVGGMSRFGGGLPAGGASVGGLGRLQESPTFLNPQSSSQRRPLFPIRFLSSSQRREPAAPTPTPARGASSWRTASTETDATNPNNHVQEFDPSTSNQSSSTNLLTFFSCLPLRKRTRTRTNSFNSLKR